MDDKQKIIINNLETEMLHEWICDKLMKIGSINKSISSYGLKHIAERQLGFYISNDRFIDAMLFAGFKYSVPNNNSVNLFFNVSKKSITNIQKEQK
jgi:hypothetical protein